MMIITLTITLIISISITITMICAKSSKKICSNGWTPLMAAASAGNVAAVALLLRQQVAIHTANKCA